MAKIDITGFEYLDRMFSEIGNKTIKAVEKGMEDSIPVIKKAEQDAIRRVTGGKDSFLAQSIRGITPIRHNAWGMFTAIGPVGLHHTYVDRKTRSRVEVTNAEIGAYLEYGVRSHNQKPRPWVESAKRATEQKVVDSLQSAIDREVDAL